MDFLYLKIIFLFYFLYPCYGMEKIPPSDLLKLIDEEFKLNSSNLLPDNYGKTWLLLPDGKNTPKVAFLSEAPTRKFSILNELRRSVSYYLYSRNNKKPIKMRQGNKLFGTNKQIKIIIHGWYSSYDSEITEVIKNAYLSIFDCYVIGVDWSHLSKNPFYFTAASDTRLVGEEISDFIDALVTKQNINIENIHLIGHSLGAHISGFAANNVESGSITRITGLDPAMPGFEYITDNDEHLDASDALFVDVYHTSGGTLGYSSPIGTIDVYMNGGFANQPGCEGVLETLNICSHSRSYIYYAESITSNIGFYGIKCSSYYAYNKLKCDDHQKLVGEPISLSLSGSYYVDTNTKSPFAMGPKIN